MKARDLAVAELALKLTHVDQLQLLREVSLPQVERHHKLVSLDGSQSATGRERICCYLGVVTMVMVMVVCAGGAVRQNSRRLYRVVEVCVEGTVQ